MDAKIYNQGIVMKKIIIGINSHHSDSCACILVDGKLIASVEEERFTRVKHWSGFPSTAIGYCLKEAGVSLSEVSAIAINQDPKANILRKIYFALLKRPNISMLISRALAKRAKSSIESDIKKYLGVGFAGTVHYEEHHMAHLSSAFHVSPFKESVLVSIDGFGDFSSTAWGCGSGSDIQIAKRTYFPHSMGIFYMAITQFLGFSNWGDEYKVMGLSSYGEPAYLLELRKLIYLGSNGSFRLDLDYFQHHIVRLESLRPDGGPHVGNLYTKKLICLLGDPRKKDGPITQREKDIAKSAQLIYEEVLFHILNAAYNRYKIPNLCIAGGCAMNSVANGKIKKNTPFKNIYIPPAAGDAGGAIGAAFNVWHKWYSSRSFEMNHAYWGPSFTDHCVADLISIRKAELPESNYLIKKYNDRDLLNIDTARLIDIGSVVGWFQGRMELGPRALGNRSILGDPRRADMQNILNIKIKRRESFRPFAPSILRNYVKDWFEQEDDVPFMMQVFQIRNDKKNLIPAVTHVDGTGRLQTVTQEENERYWGLINAFHKLTGVPILLNTSFNENEPIVCTPEEALNCFLRTKMDVLVMNNWLILRRIT